MLTIGGAEMGLFDWLFGDFTILSARVPKRAKFALETLAYLRQEESIDPLVSEALDEYLKKNLWSTKQKTEYTTELKKAETFRSSGMAQRRAE
jgi:hypothetical protein